MKLLSLTDEELDREVEAAAAAADEKDKEEQEDDTAEVDGKPVEQEEAEYGEEYTGEPEASLAFENYQDEDSDDWAEDDYSYEPEYYEELQEYAELRRLRCGVQSWW